MRQRGPGRTLKPVASWGGYSALFGPLVAFVALGVLVLLLRWTFRRGGSLVERRSHAGAPEEYGLLVPVSAPGNHIEAEVDRRALTDAGLRVTVADTVAGPRVMVFGADEARARDVLRRR